MFSTTPPFSSYIKIRIYLNRSYSVDPLSTNPSLADPISADPIQ